MPVVSREDGAEIWWAADGPADAPPVVLVMGLAYPSDMWFRVIPPLAERYRVIRLDNRGAGRTGDAPGAPYTVETMAADTLAVLSAAGHDSAHVIGISMGGLVAQELGLSSPERVRSLLLCATHPGIAHAVMNPEAIELLARRGQMTAEEAMEASVPFNYAPTTPRLRIEEDWAVRLPLAASQEGYRGQVEGTSRWDGLDRLPGLRVPTLLLHGEDDALVPVDNARILARHIPGAELVTLPGANHVFLTDQPERSAEVMLEWLDRQP